jgi:excisionase family DNA binding protein
MKHCNQCGAKLADAAKFCAECGAEYIAPKPKPEHTKPVLLIRKIIYGLDEAAAALSISVRKLQQLIADGEITACRQGRNVGITEWALIEYAKSKEIVTGEAMRGELKIL